MGNHALFCMLLLCLGIATWAAETERGRDQRGASNTELERRASATELESLLETIQRDYRENKINEERGHQHAHSSVQQSGHQGHDDDQGHDDHGHDHPSGHQGGHDEREDDDTDEDKDISVAVQSYEFRNDVFEDVRWQQVYADDFDARDDRVMNSLTSAQEKIIVDLHNELRRKEGASNMEILKYNPKLAELGQTWSKRCVFEHGQPPFSQANVGYKDLGQNIYSHTDPNFKVEDAVHAWYNEKKDYQYNSASCNPGKVCGHYTAVTWAKTTEVGCGLTFCPSISGLTKAHFIVCNYAPAGNFQGEKPFLKGPACTQCDSGKFFCNKDLCDKSCSSDGANCQCKADCKKGGKKTGNCKCDCPAGSTGPDCGLQCADRDPKCGANPGYPQFMCNMPDPSWAFVKEKCPKLCKICSAKRSNTDEERGSMLKRLMTDFLEKELHQHQDENEINSD